MLLVNVDDHGAKNGVHRDIEVNRLIFEDDIKVLLLSECIENQVMMEPYVQLCVATT